MLVGKFWHKGLEDEYGTGYGLVLDSDVKFEGSSAFNSTTPTATQVTVGQAGSSGVESNKSGDSYVMYLFGHDTSSEGMIQCGRYTGNGSNPGPSVTLGFEPQWLMVKDITNNNDWFIWDTIRGLPASVANSSRSLNPNKSDAETAEYGTAPTATGFQLQDNNAAINQNNSVYIYMAIRRGPMATPTSRANVFALDTTAYTGSDAQYPAFGTTNLADFVIVKIVALPKIFLLMQEYRVVNIL